MGPPEWDESTEPIDWWPIVRHCIAWPLFVAACLVPIAAALAWHHFEVVHGIPGEPCLIFTSVGLVVVMAAGGITIIATQ